MIMHQYLRPEYPLSVIIAASQSAAVVERLSLADECYCPDVLTAATILDSNSRLS